MVNFNIKLIDPEDVDGVDEELEDSPFHNNNNTNIPIYKGARLKLNEFNVLFSATMDKIQIPESQKDIVLDLIRFMKNSNI